MVIPSEVFISGVGYGGQEIGNLCTSERYS